MRKKIIVTGGAGFIGSHTVVELLANGYDPIIIDNLSNSQQSMLEGIQQITGVRLKFYNIDCKNQEAVYKVFMLERDVVGLIHFAAYKSVSESGRDPIKYYENNLGSLLVMIKAMREFGVKQLVFSSSATVYGQADLLPVTEDAPLKKAVSAYGLSKQMCEQIICDAVKSY
ncbi:MAG: NAD-dependent epimerase/dehydratase family protein, partial [Flavobacteriales bacterium]|nr:NAD-dependent epimerase/dehydratase family protein [Flavobacteriales bacterium]